MTDTRASKEYTELKSFLVQEFDRIHKRLDSIEQRLDKVEQRLDKVEQRLTSVEDDVNTIASVFGFTRNSKGKLHRITGF